MNEHAKLILGALLFAQAMFLASTFGTWWPVTAVLAVTFLCVWLIRRPGRSEGSSSSRAGLSRWARRIGGFGLFLMIVVVTAAWRLGGHFGESINPILVGLDILSHAAVFSSLAVWVMRPERGHLSLLPLGMLAVLLCVAAGGISRSLAAQTTIGLVACLGYAVASQIVLSKPRDGSNPVPATGRSADARSNWLAPLFSMLTLSLLLMVTSAVANVTEEVLPSIQDRLKQQLQDTLDAVANESYIGGTRYVRGSKLGSIRDHLTGDPQGVALRVFANVPPGYLRGSVFDVYSAKRWHSADKMVFGRPPDSIRDHVILPVGIGSSPLQSPRRRPLLRFPLATVPSENTVNLEIHNDPLKGSMVFLPLTTHWLEASGRELVVSPHGVVTMGVDPTRPYVAGVGASLPRESLHEQRETYLMDLPAALTEDLKSLAGELCVPQSAPPVKAAAISGFFQKTFEYSLAETDTPRGVDPLEHFLRERHPAHCEYFASATVLLLRAAGVPARYVTGYIVDEPDDEEDKLWLARNRDAHAWAEAFDSVTGRWFAVESTPGRTYQTASPVVSDDLGPNPFGVLDTSVDADGESLYTRFIAWVLSFRATAPLLMLFRLAQLPLFCVLAFLLWSKYLRPSGDDRDPKDLQSHKMLRYADRQLKKRSLVRGPSETLFQFADRIERHGVEAASEARDPVWYSKMARWYRAYASARYQGQLPQPMSFL